jgi:hypothetical protein
MQQRFEDGLPREITVIRSAVKKEEITHKQGDRDEAPAVIHEKPRWKQNQRGDGADGEDKEEGGEDSPDASFVETDEAEIAFGDAARNDGGDQIPGNDEEDVDADEAARKTGDVRVEEDDGQNGDGAQPVDLGR